MPEGAEVRLCGDLLASELTNNQLQAVVLVSGKLKRLGVKNIESLALPQLVLKVAVKGKLIMISLANGSALFSTLGMSGWWYLNEPPGGIVVYNSKGVELADYVNQQLKYTRAKLEVKDKFDVLFVDMRNFGNMYALSADELAVAHPFDKLGPDLLAAHEAGDLAPLLKVFKEASSGIRKLKIGEALLHQDLVSGLGNIYRAEALFLAKLNPNTLIQHMSEDQWVRLMVACQIVLIAGYINKAKQRYPIELLKAFHPVELDAFANVTWFNRSLVYAQAADIYGNPIIGDDSFNRRLWWSPSVQTDYPCS